MDASPMELGLHIAATKQNDTFYALFNESMRECACTIYPKQPEHIPGVEAYAMAWLTLFLFMLFVVAVALYLIHKLQQCTRFIQEEFERNTEMFIRLHRWFQEPAII